MKELPLIFGISGVARSGKDTLARHLSEKLSKSSLPNITIPFAYEVKRDLDPFLKEKLGISAFTDVTSEKAIIRPMLVAYATDVCRKKDSFFWIKKIEERVKIANSNKIIVLIPDVRYENEVKWIKENGGFVIHVTRMGIKPCNFEEKANDPIIKKLADFRVQWKTFSDEKETCNYHLSKLFYKNKWSTYGEFK
jgi:hypothetical protein